MEENIVDSAGTGGARVLVTKEISPARMAGIDADAIALYALARPDGGIEFIPVSIRVDGMRGWAAEHGEEPYEVTVLSRVIEHGTYRLYELGTGGIDTDHVACAGNAMFDGVSLVLGARDGDTVHAAFVSECVLASQERPGDFKAF